MNRFPFSPYALRPLLRLHLLALLLCAAPVLSLTARAAPASPQAPLYKCTDGSAVTYTDQPCPGPASSALTPAPLTTVPALRPTPSPSRPPATRPAQASGGAPADAAAPSRKKRCDTLAMRRRWADEDVQEVRSRLLLPGDKTLDKAKRKARRVDEQYRLECTPPA